MIGEAMSVVLVLREVLFVSISVRDRKRSRVEQLLVHENGMARGVPYPTQAFGLSHNYLGLICCWFLVILLVPPNDYEIKR